MEGGRREEGNNLQPTCIFESRKLAFQILRTFSKEYHIYHGYYRLVNESIISMYIPTLHAYLPGRKSEFILYM